MKPYVSLYLNSFGYDENDFIPSEISEKKANDIHHIECKGMGGDPTCSKDRLENLIALTREEHDEYGDKKQYMSFLYAVHMKNLEIKNIPFDKAFIINQIKKYK